MAGKINVTECIIKIRNKLWQFTAMAMVGLMVMANTPTDALASSNEWVVAGTPSQGAIDQWNAEGLTVVVFDNNGNFVARHVPGQPPETDFLPSTVLLHDHPELSAQREDARSNGALHNAILEWVSANRTTEYLGRHGVLGNSAEGQRLGQELMEIIREVAPTDPLFANTLGKNEQGKEVFFDSFDLEFSTATRGESGNFHIVPQVIEVAKNVMRNDRVVQGRTNEQIAHTIIYEIGRALGWEEIMCMLLAQEAGATPSGSSLRWDPSLERAAAHAAGGIQHAWKAASGREAGVDEFMDENIPLANPYLDYDNAQWRMARTVASIIINPSTTGPEMARTVSSAFTAQGGNRTQISRLQTDIRIATDHNLPEEEQRFQNATQRERNDAARRATQMVEMLAEIGMENRARLIGQGLMEQDWRPVVSLNDPEMRVVPLLEQELATN